MNKKEEKRRIKHTQNLNIKQLKNKAKETKKVSKLRQKSTNKELSKSELKRIKKQNNSPKGFKDIQNTEGNIIDVNGLDKTFISGSNTFKALKNVSFSIKKGSLVVILGKSGSGKSTLLNVLSGLDRPTDGEIVVNNINISALSQKDLTTFRRNNVGFIFQSYNLLQELNAEDNVRLGEQLQMDKNKRIDVKELFVKLGMEDRMKSSISELSGGQSQRISIMRALAKNPSIIFADEPTAALDSNTSKAVLTTLRAINKKYKTTIIIVTHDEKMAEHADMIINVKDGKINVE